MLKIKKRGEINMSVETDDINKIEKEINEMINKNGYNAIDTNDFFSEYKPISNYKNELEISGQKANEVLERIGFIEREEKTKNIHLTQKGRKFGKELLSFFTLKKAEGILTIPKSFVYWNRNIVDKIKKHLKGEKSDE